MYDTLRAETRLDTEYPRGLVMHAASEIAGILQVAQVWETEKDMRCFDDDIAPLLREVGAQPTVDMFFELHHLVTP